MQKETKEGYKPLLPLLVELENTLTRDRTESPKRGANSKSPGLYMGVLSNGASARGLKTFGIPPMMLLVMTTS